MYATLRRQLLKSNMFAHQQTLHGVPKEVRVSPVIEPEGDFVQVGGQMLGADLVEGTNQAAFKQAPHVLNGVDVVVAGDFSPLLVDGFVGRNAVHFVVGGQPVGNHHFDVLPKVALDEFDKARAVHLGDGFKLDAPAALHHAHHAGLPCAASGLAVAFAADERLVHFNDAVQRFGVLHRLADAVAQIPRRLVGDAQRAFDLVGGHAFLGFAHDIDGQKPFPERQVGIVEDVAGRDGELVAAFVAVVLAAILYLRDAGRLAARAADAFRPAQGFHVVAAFFLTLKVLNEFNQVHFHI